MVPRQQYQRSAHHTLQPRRPRQHPGYRTGIRHLTSSRRRASDDLRHSACRRQHGQPESRSEAPGELWPSCTDRGERAAGGRRCQGALAPRQTI